MRLVMSDFCVVSGYGLHLMVTRRDAPDIHRAWRLEDREPTASIENRILLNHVCRIVEVEVNVAPAAVRDHE